MIAWRLCRRRYAALDGEGARLVGGRWNPRGVAAVYLAESISLAALECLVHFQPATAPTDYVAIRVTFDASLLETPARLPKTWRDDPPSASQSFGAKWLAEARTAVLAVPSVVVPLEKNFVLNPAHPDFATIQVDAPLDFRFDERLLIP
ncbi:MAG: RES domain-containing protein [Deltaproteobacteria bacterium]|nr:RES domain-containing protein [Deltaproteobacteria bacterium]